MTCEKVRVDKIAVKLSIYYYVEKVGHRAKNMIKSHLNHLPAVLFCLNLPPNVVSS